MIVKIKKGHDYSCPFNVKSRNYYSKTSSPNLVFISTEVTTMSRA